MIADRGKDFVQFVFEQVEARREAEEAFFRALGGNAHRRALMTALNRDERLPDRMRDYRIEAELRESPDLHNLAQLFIGMARARAEQDRSNSAPDHRPPDSGACRSPGVESEQQEAND